MAARKGVQLTQTEVTAIVGSIETQGEVIDEMLDDQKHVQLTLATVETKLETLLQRTAGIVGSVSGESGLISKVAVLESQVEALQKELTDRDTQENNNKNHTVAQWSMMIAAVTLVFSVIMQVPSCKVMFQPPREETKEDTAKKNPPPTK